MKCVSLSFSVCVALGLLLTKGKCALTNNDTTSKKEAADDEVAAASLEGCATSLPYSNLSSFEFEPRSVADHDTACLAFRMFQDMGFVDPLNVSVPSLSRFILQVQKGYQTLPYHNWHHGLGVLHFAYAVLKNCQIIEENHLTALEGLALMAAAMCHDIDHRGLDNHFHNTTNSSLARLYPSGSIMEKHHINVTLNMLENPDTNFVSKMTEEDVKDFRLIIELAILATDLPRQLKHLAELREMAAEGFDRNNPSHKHLLMSLVISCGDLSDQTKSWASARQVARELFEEFFSQGDEEKSLGLAPLNSMNRDTVDIPSSQVEFISRILIPIFRVLSDLYNSTTPVLHRLEKNLANWNASIPYFKHLEDLGKDKLNILNDSSLNSSVFV